MNTFTCWCGNQKGVEVWIVENNLRSRQKGLLIVSEWVNGAVVGRQVARTSNKDSWQADNHCPKLSCFQRLACRGSALDMFSSLTSKLQMMFPLALMGGLNTAFYFSDCFSSLLITNVFPSCSMKSGSATVYHMIQNPNVVQKRAVPKK